MPEIGAELRIRAEYAKLIAPFVSTDPARYYLSGFYAQRHPSGGALIVATDGHSLGCFWDEFGEVAVPGIIALRKTTIAACEPERTLVVEADRASVYELYNPETQAGLLVAAQDGAVIDGQFPDWRAVIPNLPPKVDVATFAHRLIQKFKNIKRPGDKSAALRVYASSSKDAALVLTDRDDFIGVIMPYQAQIADQLPRWLPPYRGKTAWPKEPAKPEAAKEEGAVDAVARHDGDSVEIGSPGKGGVRISNRRGKKTVEPLGGAGEAADLEKAEAEGAEAGSKEHPTTEDCPYPHPSPLRKAWERGWCASVQTSIEVADA